MIARPDPNPLSTVGFTYDKANRRTKLTLPNTVTVDTVYDQASRITGLTYKMGSTVLGNLTYGYDANGRRTNVGGSMARTNLPAPFTSATYDNANEQLTMGTRGMTYDNNGNLTSLTELTGLSTFSWNARNQLAGMTGPGLSASFLYDPLGRRIKRTLNSAVTQFAHDGINVVEELSASGSVTATLLTGLGIDEVFRRTDASGGSQHFLTDVLGSTVALLDSLGLIQTEYTSTPFGETTATGMASSNAFQFTGRENDGTGLHYNRARYYHPGLQRFISEDPIGFRGGDVNLYGYTGNDPVNLKDWSGKDIAVIENGSTFNPSTIEGNPLGHTATAVTGAGVYSFGNNTPTGSSMIQYLLREAPNRDTTVHVIPTRPDQDAAALQYLQSPLGPLPDARSNPIGALCDNCSTRSNRALDAAGIPNLPASDSFPGSAGLSAQGAGAYSYFVPKGTDSIPVDPFIQFEPR